MTISVAGCWQVGVPIAAMGFCFSALVEWFSLLALVGSRCARGSPVWWAVVDGGCGCGCVVVVVVVVVVVRCGVVWCGVLVRRRRREGRRDRRVTVGSCVGVLPCRLVKASVTFVATRWGGGRRGREGWREKGVEGEIVFLASAGCSLRFYAFFLSPGGACESGPRTLALCVADCQLTGGRLRPRRRRVYHACSTT